MDLTHELAVALNSLVTLKDYKGEFGKDEYYIKTQPKAWEWAREALAKCESVGIDPTSEPTNKALRLQNVVPSTLTCSRCGTIYEIVEGSHMGCCTMPAEHRTSNICGGALVLNT